MFNSGDQIDNLKASLCESEGVRTRCQPDACSGAWTDWFGDQYCSEGYWCCRLDNVDEYFPPGTVLIDADGKLDATFRVEPRSSSEQYSKMTLEFGNEKAKRWIEDGIPKDVKLTVRYKPAPQPRGRSLPGQPRDERAEMPSKCSTTLIGQTFGSWDSESVPCTQLDSFGFVKRDDAISPVEIAKKNNRVVGVGGVVPLTIRIGYTMPNSDNRLATPDIYVVKIDQQKEENVERES